jgi:hypothetical protein
MNGRTSQNIMSHTNEQDKRIAFWASVATIALILAVIIYNL